MISTARYPSPNASRYVQQLAKHFAHKIEVQLDADSAEFTLQAGSVRLEAKDDMLLARVEAEDAKSLIDARYVIDKHLVIFAFREGFVGLEWKVVEAA